MLLPMVSTLTFGHPLTGFDIFISFIWLIFFIVWQCLASTDRLTQARFSTASVPIAIETLQAMSSGPAGSAHKDNSGKKLEFREHLLGCGIKEIPHRRWLLGALHWVQSCVSIIRVLSLQRFQF